MLSRAFLDRHARAALYGVADVWAQIAGSEVRAKFDARYLDALGVETAGPALTVASADLPEVTHATAVTVDGVAYRVIGIQPDGTGLTVLRLERQS